MGAHVFEKLPLLFKRSYHKVQPLHMRECWNESNRGEFSSFVWIYMWPGHLKQSSTQVWYTMLTAKAGTVYFCRNPGSNQGPLDLQSNALPSELFRPNELIFSTTKDLFLCHIFNVLVSKLTKEVNSALPHPYWNVQPAHLAQCLSSRHSCKVCIKGPSTSPWSLSTLVLYIGQAQTAVH